MPKGNRTRQTQKKNFFLIFFALFLATAVFWLLPEPKSESEYSSEQKTTEAAASDSIAQSSIVSTASVINNLNVNNAIPAKIAVSPELAFSHVSNAIEPTQPTTKLTSEKPSKHFEFITVQSGNTLYSIFRKLNISTKTLMEIQKLPKASSALKRLHLNQRMRFQLDSENNLISLALAIDKSHTLVIFRAGSKFTARVERAALRGPSELDIKQTTVETAKTTESSKPKPAAPTTSKTANTKIKITPPPLPKIVPTYLGLHYTGVTIKKSLYGDGKKQGIPYKIIAQLVQIFALQINFKDIRPGDKVVIAYDDALAKGKKIGPGNIIAAKFTRGKRVYAVIRYVNPQGNVEYLNPSGEGTKKAFNRFPVKYTHINSLFNMHRVHPVTHVSRPHNGVDLAGPLGAPVQSIGDGTVQFIGWDGDYGNLVTIQHNDKYSSKYAHLLRFAPGIHKGSHVTRGQLIGYLGQTGNATGPHVHFEVRVYNKPVNPLTAPLPYVETIPTAQKNAFRNKAKNLIAALDQYQKNNLK